MRPSLAYGSEKHASVAHDAPSGVAVAHPFAARVAATLAGLALLAACGDDASPPAEDAADVGHDDAEDDARDDATSDDTAPTSDVDGSDGPDDDAGERPADATTDTSGADVGPIDDADAQADADESDVAPPPLPESVADCFADVVVRDGFTPDYDRFSPVVGRHCEGTNHQQIEGIERVVFAGDSITVGTPPSRPPAYYRTILTERLVERFGEDLVVDSVAAFGARTDDLLLPSNEQLRVAFPDEVDPRRTLVVMTVGGNDLFRWAERNTQGRSNDEILEMVDEAADLFDDAIRWLVDDARFPNGIFVVFANTYEYTDGTGEVQSCGISDTIGITEPWPEGQEAITRFNERYMQTAVETGTDVVFLLEAFCGHGFMRGTPDAVCDRGEDAPVFFDPTCIHPNPAGHQRIADMFWAVITEPAYSPVD